MCKKLIKNSQPFGKKSQKTGGEGVDSHCTVGLYMLGANCQGTHPTNSKRLPQYVVCLYLPTV